MSFTAADSPAMAGTRPAAAEPTRGTDHRGRLIEGMVAAVTERGYPATTIADIVRHARVSKRTFYEHFGDREDCFLACFERGTEIALRAVGQAADTRAPWPVRVRAAAHAYLSTLSDNAAMARTLLVDVHAAGPRAVALRRSVLERFARLLCDLVEHGRRDYPEVRPLPLAMAVALVGGINELVLITVESGRIDQLHTLTETVTDLVESVLRPR